MSYNQYGRVTRGVNLKLSLSMPVIFTILFLPFYVYAMPGFEITPSLLFAPLLVFLVNRKLDVILILAVLYFLSLGTISAIFASEYRRALSAFTAVSPMLYLILGMESAKHADRLDGFSKNLLPVFWLIVITVLPEAIQNDLVVRSFGTDISSSFAVGKYASGAFSFVNLAAPFYGKFGILTFGSILFAVLALVSPSVLSLRNKYIRYPTLIGWLLLAVVCINLLSLQIYLGFAIAILTLIIFSSHLRAKYLLLIFTPFIFILTAIYSEYLLEAIEVIAPDLHLNIAYLISGNFERFSSGRTDILATFFSNLQVNHVLFGCGFCDLRQDFKIEFSSAHFSLLTSFGKGGLPLVIFQGLFIFIALRKLFLSKKSLTRNIFTAFMISTFFQSLSWDILQLQVISPLIFTLCGFVIKFSPHPGSARSIA